jgi:hypothetical protein
MLARTKGFTEMEWSDACVDSLLSRKMSGRSGGCRPSHMLLISSPRLFFALSSHRPGRWFPSLSWFLRPHPPNLRVVFPWIPSRSLPLYRRFVYIGPFTSFHLFASSLITFSSFVSLLSISFCARSTTFFPFASHPINICIYPFIPESNMYGTVLFSTDVNLDERVVRFSPHPCESKRCEHESLLECPHVLYHLSGSCPKSCPPSHIVFFFPIVLRGRSSPYDPLDSFLSPSKCAAGILAPRYSLFKDSTYLSASSCSPFYHISPQAPLTQLLAEPIS